MAELTVEDVFRIHPKIRWAAYATEEAQVLFSKMRPGVKSISPETEDEAFMQLGPQVVLGVFERFSPYAGPVSMASGDYEKVFMFVAKVRGGVLALTIDKHPESELLQTVPTIIKSIRDLG
jgi:hypothetical protein